MISYPHIASGSDITELPRFLLGLAENYPDFQDWLLKKAIPSLGGEGEIVLAKQGYEIVGVALGKRTTTEKKIRCVRVAESHRKTGIGATLIEKMMVRLDCDKPLITVPQGMIHDYSRILINHFHYDLTFVDRGLYIENSLEYIFNGGLT